MSASACVVQRRDRPHPGELVEEDGANYVGACSSSQRTRKKRLRPVGIENLDGAAANLAPLVAVGGVKKHTVAEVAAHGARCVRLVSDAADAEDIPPKTEAISTHLQGFA